MTTPESEPEIDKLFRIARERGNMPWVRPELVPEDRAGLEWWEIGGLMRSRDAHNTMQRFLAGAPGNGR